MGCLTSNLAMPGVGSLVAGRRSGYAQLVLALVGMALSLTLTVRLAVWYHANVGRLTDPDADPGETLAVLARAFFWPFMSFVIFGVGWLWSLATGLAIVKEAKADDRSSDPPKLFSRAQQLIAVPRPPAAGAGPMVPYPPERGRGAPVGSRERDGQQASRRNGGSLPPVFLAPGWIRSRSAPAAAPVVPSRPRNWLAARAPFREIYRAVGIDARAPARGIGVFSGCARTRDALDRS